MPTSQSSQHRLSSGTILGNYRVLHVLGEGGFGITYLAEDIQLLTQVVIKEYFPTEFALRTHDHNTIVAKGTAQEIYTKGLQRFKEEARTLAQFNHPSIVRILSFFEANGTAYFVMNYEEGEDLSHYLRSHPAPLSQETILSIIMPILEGLKEVHAHHYLHRDIKPGNILLRQDKAPVLIDFGASKLAIGEASRSITSMLTEGYAPLEQYSTDIKQQGAFSDLYAIGAVMYRMITGEVPPSALTRSQAVMSGQSDPYVPLIRRDLTDCTAGFLLAINTTLIISTRERPQSVSAFQAMIAGEVARPAGAQHAPAGPSATTQKDSSTTTKRSGVGIWIAVTMIILLGGAGYYYYDLQEQERVRIEAEVRKAQVELKARRQAEKIKAEARRREEIAAREKAEREAKERKQALARAKREAEEAQKKALEASRLQAREPTTTIGSLMWKGSRDLVSEEETTWQGAKVYCENLDWAGYADWRLPTLNELEDVVTECGGKVGSSDNFKNSACQNFCTSCYYWSSTTLVGDTNYALIVRFDNGHTYGHYKSDGCSVRCVREISARKKAEREAAARKKKEMATRKKAERETAVRKQQASLVWQGDQDFKPKTRTWQAAKQYCENLDWAGHTNWHLPTRDELEGVVTVCGGVSGSWEANSKNTAYQKCYQQKGFDGQDGYWSSAAHAYLASDAWLVSFNYGHTYYNPKSHGYYVRCVR